MKPLTITIEPPITEHCRKCDYAAARSFGSVLCKCPECGATAMYQGARLPEKRALRATKHRGSYNWANESEKQWQYFFRNAPNGKQYSFVVNEELETDSPIDLSLELKEIIDRYMISSSKTKIAELVELIDTDEYQEEQDMLRANERRVELERELFELSHRTGCYS